MNYSMIAETRDTLLPFGYSSVIDSTAPFNVTRQFLLTTRIKPLNPLLVVVTADMPILLESTLEKYGDKDTVIAYEKRWKNPARRLSRFQVQEQR